MSNNSLKSKATKGMLWSALDKFTVQGGQFVIGIILARLLMPEDFGLIGMLSIFIAISQTFVNSGMGSGLIQKHDRSDVDFSTVFIFNLSVSVFFYALLYFSAPLIADFFKTPQLVKLTRVLSLNILINSLAIVQRTKLTISLDFKTIAKVNVISVLGAGIFAIYFAYTGWGVWALVFQNLIRAVVSVFMFWLLSKWKPSFIFSKKSFKALFGFGSKILISALYATGLKEVYNIAIGKVYSATDLGFYTRSKQITDSVAGTVTSILEEVTFPILASIQNDQERLVSVFSRLLRMVTFFSFPVMTLLALLAKPFIILLLTEKWAPSIILLQWLCFSSAIRPISTVNLNILKAIGRSDLFLKVDLFKAPFIIVALIITIPMGLKAIVIGNVITSGISFLIETYMPGKLFGYGGFSQIKDMIPIIIATAIMSIVVYISIYFIDNLLLKLMVGGLVGVLTYWLVTNFLKVEETSDVKILIKNLSSRIRKES